MRVQLIFVLKIEKKWETTGKNCALDPQPRPKDRSRLRHISSGAPLSHANLSCHDRCENEKSSGWKITITKGGYP